MTKRIQYLLMVQITSLFAKIRKIMVNNKLVIIVISFLFLCIFSAVADNFQSQVLYEYDAAGNRISRELVQQRSFQSPNLQRTNFNVYPTVVTDVVNITTQDEINPSQFSYTITNISGNIVMTGNILSQNTQVQVSLLQGYYILNIFSETEQYSFNLLKN